ncbi:hypothetical protein [Vibrio neptunius]|uniref:Uncharacterized protein n=1 Tax=Vibrio neptunius TaxID=170651 RepID=A0ABS3A160_9VIBR|nr:hypothetical protein [Vibrio neptunius]MBN3493468.1 hypothetical protein [Vibrio neptunius]MBN3515838.1 hypothetical protein [Vibrio neptunius]MBN3550137.1 hypothetical protein [Vibrio neptunius]MBN3578143.1 hypothetical protein [Vibrio neptunius]MCH9871807.1 hypothetical protein [Vibrio neptunius]
MVVTIDVSDFSGQPKYMILNGVLDLLLANGNELATEYKWGSNPTGYFAVLKRPIDFELVRANFKLPSSVYLNERFGEIDYGLGTVVIRVTRKKRHDSDS